MRHIMGWIVIASAGLAPVAMARDVPRTASDLQGFVLTPLRTLPRSADKSALDDFCSGYRIAPTSTAGKLVAGQGWIVTSEANLGRYQAVSFAGSFEPGTSGVCFAHDSNIAVFEGSELVALAYADKSAKRPLGPVSTLEGGGLLIEGGDGPSAPIGELHEADGGLRITALPAEQTVCAGKAVVPNIYGKPIAQARKLLIAKGWKPVRPAEAPGDIDLASTLAKQGIVEAEACSGTGYGFCSFSYSAKAGTLSVGTIGADTSDTANEVINYTVTCH